MTSKMLQFVKEVKDATGIRKILPRRSTSLHEFSVESRDLNSDD